MAGLPKGLIKRFGGDLKKAWAHVRKGRSGPRKKAHKKKRTRARAARASGKPSRQTGGENMAKRRKRSRRRTVRHVARRTRRRVGVAMSSRPAQILMGAGIATVGAVGTSFAINNVPKVKDLSAGWKSGIQVGLGLAGIFLVRYKSVKALGAGAVVAGVMGGVKALTGINPMAGPSAGGSTLSYEQTRRLINGGGMSAPIARLSRPAPVRMHGSFNGGSPSKGFGGLDM